MLRSLFPALFTLCIASILTPMAHATHVSVHGRFLQSDPIGLGVQTAGTMRGGQAPHPAIGGPDLGSHFGDGYNTFGYLTANPINAREPAGTSLIGLGLGVAGGIAGVGLPGATDIAGGALRGMVNGYGQNLGWDVAWATDWSMPDEMHTRVDNSWVALSMAQGVYDSFEQGRGDYTVNPLDMFMGSGSPMMASRGGSRAPPGWRDAKRHGDMFNHFLPMQHIARAWEARMPGLKGMHLNRGLRGPDGKILRGPNGELVRPDVQFWNNGRLYIKEVINTSRDPERARKIRRILEHNGISPGRLNYEEPDGPSFWRNPGG